MDRFACLLQRIELIKQKLKITEIDEAEIDSTLEDWIVEMINKKLVERGLIEHEK